MEGMTVAFEKFDLDKLIEKTLEFAKLHFRPYFAIPWIYEPGDSTVYGRNEEDAESYDNLPEYSDRDYRKELVEEGKLLFFTFSTNNVGEPVACADGVAYLIEDGEISEDEYETSLGDTECLGYLLEQRNGSLTIRSSVNSSGACMCPSSINIMSHCGIFDKPMREYIKKFIRQ